MRSCYAIVFVPLLLSFVAKEDEDVLKDGDRLIVEAAHKQFAQIAHAVVNLDKLCLQILLALRWCPGHAVRTLDGLRAHAFFFARIGITILCRAFWFIPVGSSFQTGSGRSRISGYIPMQTSHDTDQAGSQTLHSMRRPLQARIKACKPGAGHGGSLGSTARERGVRWR